MVENETIKPSKNRTFEVKFTVNLIEEDSDATVKDVEDYILFALKKKKLSSNNYFFEYGLDEMGISNPIVNEIKANQ